MLNGLHVFFIWQTLESVEDIVDIEHSTKSMLNGFLD